MVQRFPVVSRCLKTGWLLIVLMLWAGSASAASTTLMVMGDSLSAAYGIERQSGWVNLLSERLGDDVEVINASISGETTAGGATRLPELLGQHDPDIVLLELGGNDGLRGLPPRQMRANLSEMIEASQRAGAQVLLLGIQVPPNYGQAYATAFRNVYHELAEEYDVPLVPFLLDGIALDASLMQDDGIHPTAEAQSMILDNVWPTLKTLLPSVGSAVAHQ
nr:arylesterase [uncultured Halomonas sp.]